MSAPRDAICRLRKDAERMLVCVCPRLQITLDQLLTSEDNLIRHIEHVRNAHMLAARNRMFRGSNIPHVIDCRLTLCTTYDTSIKLATMNKLALWMF